MTPDQYCTVASEDRLNSTRKLIYESLGVKPQNPVKASSWSTAATSLDTTGKCVSNLPASNVRRRHGRRRGCQSFWLRHVKSQFHCFHVRRQLRIPRHTHAHDDISAARRDVTASVMRARALPASQTERLGRRSLRGRTLIRRRLRAALSHLRLIMRRQQQRLGGRQWPWQPC